MATFTNIIKKEESHENFTSCNKVGVLSKWKFKTKYTQGLSHYPIKIC